MIGVRLAGDRTNSTKYSSEQGTHKMANRSSVQSDCTEDIRDLPPSAKLVFKSLQYRDELTQKGLVEETRLCPRTVRDARSKLEEKGIVTSRRHFKDARQHVYSLAAPFQPDDTDGS